MTPSAAHAASPPEFTSASRFRWIRTLGEGGMGVVHEVWDTERRSRVALKTLRTTTADGLLSFKREFRTLRDLQHPHLVALGDLVEENGEWFFTMELVCGVDFLAYVRPADPLQATALQSDVDKYADTVPALKEAPAFDERRLRTAARQLASAVSALHRAGKVHRDIKPSNLLVTADDRLVVLDFGLVVDFAATNAKRTTAAGTIGYMAPEQAKGGAVGPAADWYAVGVLLFEAMTGGLPHEAATMAELLRRKREEDAPSPDDIVADLPDDLVSLAQRLLRRNPYDRPAEAEILEILGVAKEPGWIPFSAIGAPERVFVGRSAELARLEEAYEASCEGRPVSVFIEGESGVGKSALVEHFVQRIKAKEKEKDGSVVILRGRCHEHESVPFKAVDGILDDLGRLLQGVQRTRVHRLAPRRTRELIAVFPTLGAVRGLHDESEDTTPATPSHQLRERAFAAVAELLRNVGRRRPLIAIIDDVQWADADSLALLRELLLPSASPPWLLLMTERRSSPDKPPSAARALARGDVRTVTVSGLGDEEARALLKALTRRDGMSGDVSVETLVGESQGHPMFLEELVVHAGRGSVEQGPLRLDEALWARALALPPLAQEVLHLVVTAQGPLTLGLLADLVPAAREVFAEQVSLLRAERLLRVQGSTRADPVEPFHDRVREAVYARLGDVRRTALHGRMLAGHATAGAPSDVLAVHAHLAGKTKEARTYAERAVRENEASFAYARAADMLRLLLRVSDRNDTRRAHWTARLGDNLARAGRPKDAAEAYLSAATLVPAEDRFELERRGAEQLLEGGYLEEGLRAARPVLAAVGLSLPETTAGVYVRLMREQWGLLFTSLEKAPPPQREIPEDVAARLDVLWMMGTRLGVVDAARGAVFQSCGLRHALGVADGFRRARALSMGAFYESARGDRERAARFVAAAERAAEDDGSPLSRFYALLAQAARLFMADTRLPPTITVLREARSLWDAAGRGAGWEKISLEQFMSWALYHTGNFAELTEQVTTTLRFARQNGHRYLETAMRLGVPAPYLLQDRPDEAEADIKDALGSWRREDAPFGIMDYWALLWRTRIYLYGDGLVPEEELEALWARCRASLIVRVRLVHMESTVEESLFYACRAARARRRGQESLARSYERRSKSGFRIPEDPTLAPTWRLERQRLHIVRALSDGREGDALVGLRSYVTAVRAEGFENVASAARHRIGRLLGGAEGQLVVDEAEREGRARGVVNPARLYSLAFPV